MYTYEFAYDEIIDGFGCIRFCAPCYREAKELFTDWQEENDYSIPNYTVGVVYDEADAIEYEKEYKWHN